MQNHNGLILVLFLAGLVSSTAHAGRPHADRAHTRGERQDARIQQGVNSGELTHKETKRLEAQQTRIDHAQQKASSDGNLTAEEKKHIETLRNRASKNIYRQKHDGQNQ